MSKDDLLAVLKVKKEAICFILNGLKDGPKESGEFLLTVAQKMGIAEAFPIMIIMIDVILTVAEDKVAHKFSITDRGRSLLRVLEGDHSKCPEGGCLHL